LNHAQRYSPRLLQIFAPTPIAPVKGERIHV